MKILASALLDESLQVKERADHGTGAPGLIFEVVVGGRANWDTVLRHPDGDQAMSLALSTLEEEVFHELSVSN